MSTQDIINVSVCGAAGRMGRRIIACLAEDDDMRLSGTCDVTASGCVGHDSGTHAGIGENGIAISDDLTAVCASADVVIDFALQDDLPERIAVYRATRTACVVGTTAVDTTARAALEDAGKDIAILHAPNFSVGIALMCALVRRAAEVLGPDFDIEVVEAHHRRKQDAPSGTALRLVEELEAGRVDISSRRVYGREGITGARAPEDIGIHAVRGGNVVGDHTVIFAGDAERIEITHRAETRDVFARGALRAARFVARRPGGIYTLQDVLGI